MGPMLSLWARAVRGGIEYGLPGRVYIVWEVNEPLVWVEVGFLLLYHRAEHHHDILDDFSCELWRKTTAKETKGFLCLFLKFQFLG